LVVTTVELFACLQAVNDAEAALAVVQAKLLEAMKGQVALQGEMMAVKREAEHTRLKLEAEVGHCEHTLCFTAMYIVQCQFCLMLSCVPHLMHVTTCKHAGTAACSPPPMMIPSPSLTSATYQYVFCTPGCFDCRFAKHVRRAH
jgi:hypothetical protein